MQYKVTYTKLLYKYIKLYLYNNVCIYRNLSLEQQNYDSNDFDKYNDFEDDSDDPG